MIKQKRLVDYFLKIAAIKSPSGNEKELSEALQAVIGALGIPWNVDSTGNLCALLPRNTEGFEPVIFCCHMDTVKPGDKITTVMRDGVIMTDGTSILGADDKAGIAAVIEVLHLLTECDVPHGDMEIIFTVMEETGMTGAKNLDYSRIKSRVAYVADGSMKPGYITTAAPYKNRISIVLKGTAAHAGVNPEKGVSAIQVAARAIADMKLLRVDELTTANIGTISGGSSENVVCPEVVLKAEVRSHDPERLARQTDHMRECIINSASAFCAVADFNAALLYPGYCIEADEPIVSRFKSACVNAGLEFGTCTSGGGSDANIFNKSGIKAVVVGTGVKNPHAVSESISVNDLTDTVRILLELAKNKTHI